MKNTVIKGRRTLCTITRDGAPTQVTTPIYTVSLNEKLQYLFGSAPLQFFIHRPVGCNEYYTKKHWNLTERTTGRRVMVGRTREELIEYMGTMSRSTLAAIQNKVNEITGGVK